MTTLADDKLSKLTGLFDYRNSDEIVSDLMAVTGLSREKVLEKITAEYFRTGSNVVADAHTAGIDFHVYNSKMEEFYKKTNAFLFELIAVHQSPLCRQIDERIMNWMVRICGDNIQNTKVLVLGDGIGTDSLRFRRLGFNVTYFEFDGYSSSLARRRFGRTAENITVINDLEKIPAGAFDIVVCREVLEHVSDPPAVIASINKYLVDNGHAIITESFERVDPDFPTHLQSNLKYAGTTAAMFVDAGFKYAGKIDEERPFVFQKSSASADIRRSTIPRRNLFSLFARKVAFTILRRVS